MAKYEAIVLGVSAGGIEALTTLVPVFPAEYSMPVIIVQHRLPGPDEFLTEHLNEMSGIHVIEAQPNEKILPGTVYVAPGGYHLHIEPERIFSLSVDPPVNYSIPSIDVLFESAADIYKEKLIGVVLTGANADGSSGLKKIRELGGLAVVQSPKTANTATMPACAIEVAGADHILELNDIGPILLELTHEK